MIVYCCSQKVHFYGKVKLPKYFTPGSINSSCHLEMRKKLDFSPFRLLLTSISDTNQSRVDSGVDPIRQNTGPSSTIRLLGSVI